MKLPFSSKKYINFNIFLFFRPYNEKWDCGTVRGGEESSGKTDPWFVLLRFKARDSGGAAHVELDYTALWAWMVVFSKSVVFKENKQRGSCGNAQWATMSSQARWRYQARSHLEHIFW